MDSGDLILVAGAGGFIGGHLVRHLRHHGYKAIRAIDVKPLDHWLQRFDDVENHQLDLKEAGACRQAARGARTIFNLASVGDEAGITGLSSASRMLSVLINTHLLLAARDSGAERYFFSSSACIYDLRNPMAADAALTTQADPFPVMTGDGQGWEKLFSERLCRHFREEYGLLTHVARYHNVYGPNAPFHGGAEKAPASICRKVIEAKLSGRRQIEIWGDGEQTESFMYVDDCVLGTRKLLASDLEGPINMGSDRPVTVNRLIDIAERIAGITLKRNYDLTAPQGAPHRDGAYGISRATMNWAPETRIEDGLERTYRWIYNRLALRNAA